MKNFLTWVGVAFVIFFIAYRPQGAANIVRTIGAGIIDLGRGVMDFLSSLI